MLKPIIIVGYGPVGAILSLLLARNQIPVIVIEAATKYPEEPRAVGLFGPSHSVLEDAGIYEEEKRQGMPSAGLSFRKRAVDDGNGGQRMGDCIASAKFAPEVNGETPPGGHFILIPQAKLVRIIAEEMKHADLQQFATVQMGLKYLSSEETEDGIKVIAEDTEGNTHVFEGSYLVGADGSRSDVRRKLGLKLHGTSWPERLISADVLRTTNNVPEIPSCLVVDPELWAAITPLERIYPGQPGLWRYSMAVSDESVPDQELEKAEFVISMLKKHIDGPYNQEFKVIRSKPYKMHQLLCSSMRKGRTFLAGDAAHVNNPIGGLGLNTGILDADALAQTLVQVLKQGRPESLYDRYSYERRRVFQLYVDPISKSNKQRLHVSSPDIVANEDWFLASIMSDDPEEKFSPYKWMANWKTDMAAFKM
ncbi:uncharacterized protein A1O5_05636 [Cladophialophora psammophila CBS 110553]|uniref:FAD-binding domain-containing protein n=1 Tax=Cladophialophora psammophila CBS 110553 TaxID=1182543 RepID=W9X134_9EURO|nr:uncharacterized protein A1O5_05636 [Cladophialophora psammophila CBS 110553]EXJ70646.1 hypothetical protein A1O5_05636 [Cladophialophora psammophila CBS 110553]